MADSINICLHIDADPRFAAGAGGVAHFLAESGGLEADAALQLQKAVVAACEEVFEHLSKDHPHLEVTLSRLADRIEVAFSYQGEALPAVGLDAIAGFAAHGGAGGAGALSGVDRVQYETKGGVTVTRLTKYIGQGTPSR